MTCMTGITDPTEQPRIEPPLVADERTMLEGWLDFHRATLALKCQGLTDEQMRTASAPPSGMTLLGLVRHLAEVERAWFRRRLDGQDCGRLYATDQDDDGDFHHAADADPAADLAVWRAEIAEVRKVAAGYSLDHVFLSRHGEDMQLRWIYVHMIEEYARHNGHADLIRERIDGVTGE